MITLGKQYSVAHKNLVVGVEGCTVTVGLLGLSFGRKTVLIVNPFHGSKLML